MKKIIAKRIKIAVFFIWNFTYLIEALWKKEISLQLIWDVHFLFLFNSIYSNKLEYDRMFKKKRQLPMVRFRQYR